MRIVSWNIRGFNKSLKQKGVMNFLRHHKLDVIGLLETKLVEATLPKIMRTWFAGWKHTCNFHMHPAGRNLVLWNPAIVILEELDIYPQVVHCAITCKVSSVSLLASFIYGYHIVGSRKPLWDNLISFGENCSLPRIAIGDYNNVLNANEKCNGKDVTNKELKDFKECCVLTGLTDLRSMGCHFTWTNNEVWCKLDRAMVNKHWFDQGLDGMANFLPLGCLSDDSPCIVSLLDVVVNTNRSFRFFNMWASHTDFNDIFSHISSRAAKAKEDLEWGQLQLHDDPTNVDLQNFVLIMRKQSMSLSEVERCFYYQQAKRKHLNQSDRGTKFFHDLVKRNKKLNQIVVVCKEVGLPTTSIDEVAKEFTKFYECLLGTLDSCEPINSDIINAGPSISLEQAVSLERDILRQEIRDALFDIGEDKSPELFINGSLLKQINHTIIALVPKGQHAQSVGDYRPISYCNVFYKVITKIMAKRMAPLLENIVDPTQAAFVGGRLMTENIHLAQELLRQYNCK
ncbi:hypothetical protein DH2020_044024 [Rehmannia glutinosa]|uniref:Endonuclease/exonuclease/phosphatase domain-containing protein n=1 Tax=Rehmannia glutinosa TaxID=99300 RepID=A0ABR0UIY5_REHGL